MPGYNLSLYVLAYPARIMHLTRVLALRFGGDFLAGITVASMLIPQSVSYASTLAKLSPVTGLVRNCAMPRHRSESLIYSFSVLSVNSRDLLRATWKLETA